MLVNNEWYDKVPTKIQSNLLDWIMHAFYFSSVMLDTPCITGKHTLICFFCMRSHWHIYQQHRLCAYAVNNWYDTVWYSYRIIYGAVNNNFFVPSGVIRQWFSRVTQSWVNIIGESPHELPKNCYSRQPICYFIPCMLWFGLQHREMVKTVNDPLLVCDGSVYCGIVKTHEHALWHHFACPQNASKGAPAFSCRHQVHYH